MIKRFLIGSLKEAAREYPIVTLTGPRQSGKTTLIRAVFQNYSYVTLEDPDQRAFAEHDPRGFLLQNRQRVIFDEVQRVPSLFSYLQGEVDKDQRPGRFILTGSQQFLLNEKISQSLAGRAAILKLLPFSFAELTKRASQNLWTTGKLRPISSPKQSLAQMIFSGFYPRIHDKQLDPQKWLGNYFETYVSRDVRSLVNIGDLRVFENFVRLLAGRSGQLLNLSSLSSDAGITHTTARRWLSLLEASYIVRFLPPHFRNFNKRIIKSPKIYFIDSGLLCYLLKIASPKDLLIHAQLGAIFETFVISEILKSFIHQGLEAPLYFWRDKTGNEIDLIIDQGIMLFPIEIKAGKTINSDFFKNLLKWLSLPGNKQTKSALVYAGEHLQKRQSVQILPWFAV